MNQNEKDVREVITELKLRAKREEVPDRFLARVALIALGRMELEQQGSAADLARELRTVAELQQEAWEQAVESELAMAAIEHVNSVDPHFLNQALYDFEYTIAARERLEARFLATGLLDLEVPELLLDQVSEADRLLEPYLEDR